MHEEAEEFEFEYIDLDTIDDKEDEDYEPDPINEVRFQRSVGDDIYIVGAKL